MDNYRCVVVANGSFPTKDLLLNLLQQAEFVVACDGAVVELEKVRIPDIVVDDLDSLPSEFHTRYAGKMYQEHEQETNDLSKAMRYIRRMNIEEVLVLGATGLREDHTLGNISLLLEYAGWFKRIEMMSDYGIFTPLLHTASFDCKPGQQVSLFSLYPHGAISVRGLKYPIDGRRLYSWWEATLNETVGERFDVVLEEDARVLVYRALQD